MQPSGEAAMVLATGDTPALWNSKLDAAVEIESERISAPSPRSIRATRAQSEKSLGTLTLNLDQLLGRGQSS
jgi:hypothetical protein